ncbi:MAG: hypothetical protein J7496_10450 [Novosphingobium sp.]|nr:hypothetical protein [Novosphingobium sp.]MBO9602914.1 hypothetical protein [Novosphingobium sp.]
MTTRVNPALGDQQDEQAISLWNLHKSLTRLADELAQAARETDVRAGNDNRSGNEAPAPAVSPRDYFEALLRQRRARDRYFGSTLFGEPAWDIMLELMIARIDGREMRVSELALASYAPDMATRQYIDALAEAKLIDLYEDTVAQDDCFLTLSSEAARRMAELYRARSRG